MSDWRSGRTRREARQGARTAGRTPTLLGKPTTDATRGQKSRVARGGHLVPERTTIGTPPDCRQGPQELGVTTQGPRGWNTWATGPVPGTRNPTGSCDLSKEHRALQRGEKNLLPCFAGMTGPWSLQVKDDLSQMV